MTYLIAKFALLFLAATLLGFLLGYWWARSRFVDVTESFRSMTSKSEEDRKSWSHLWSRLEALNLAPLHERVHSVETLIKSLPEPEKASAVDLQPIQQRLHGVEQLVQSIPDSIAQSMPKPEAVDFAPLGERLNALEAQIKAIPAPEKSEAVDFGPLLARLHSIQSHVERSSEQEGLGLIHERLGSLEVAIQEVGKGEVSAPVDLSPLQVRLGNLESLIKQSTSSEKPEPVNLTPLHDRMAGLERALRAIQSPETVNLNPIENRLQAIEVKLGKLAEKAAQAQKPSSGPRLLKSASMGAKDDLKRISGVGPKLERLLNRLGVYYFWQVASWNPADVQAVDDMLEVFKGRIERDDWVSQAKILKQSPKAAKEFVSTNGV